MNGIIAAASVQRVETTLFLLFLFEIGIACNSTLFDVAFHV